MQQLRRHWRLFLPSPWAKPLPGWTKILEVLRCAAPLRVLFALIASLLGLGALGVALLTGAMEKFLVPDVAWILLALGTAAWLINTWHRYKLTGTTRISAIAMMPWLTMRRRTRWSGTRGSASGCSRPAG